jgi:hypothetical protein
VTEERSFSDARELFEALGTPNAIERRGVLAWVAAHPTEAIAMGGIGGRDVVDVLIGLVDDSLDYRYWQDVAMAIGAFDSPKVTGFFYDLLAKSTDAVAIMDATSALARRDLSQHREGLLGLLTSDDEPDRAVGAAELLAGAEGVSDRAAVRIAVLEEGRPVPELTPSVADAWVDELSGPFADEARTRIEGQGAAAVEAIGQRWERLGNEERAWLVGWSSEAAPSEAAELIRLGLQGSDQLVLTALRSAGGLPPGTLSPAELGAWSEHPDAAIRSAAIAAGAEVDASALLTDPDPLVAAAAIERLVGSPDADAGAIAAQLSSEHAEVRGAARDALVAIGLDALEALRPLVRSNSPEVRAAAVSALLDLGDDDWLASELLEDEKPGG